MNIPTASLIQQWLTNRRQLRLHPFDRRWDVYKAAIHLTDSIAKLDVSRHFEELGKFVAATRGACFLFNKKIQRYCDHLYDRAVQLKIDKENPKTWSDDRLLSVWEQWFAKFLQLVG
jgi:hypothetical protein